MDGHNTKQVVTSIIGHEIETKFSLLDWFLNAEGQISVGVSIIGMVILH